jgi:hypothetical protein
LESGDREMDESPEKQAVLKLWKAVGIGLIALEGHNDKRAVAAMIYELASSPITDAALSAWLGDKPVPANEQKESSK